MITLFKIDRAWSFRFSLSCGTSVFKTSISLKVLPEELASDRVFISRFEEDIAAIATLEHPNLVKIHNLTYANGLYFIVTDCVVDEFGETTNLAQYVMAQGKRMGESDLLKILKQIADALDYAHFKKSPQKEFVHRGIKFNNILIGSGKGTPSSPAIRLWAFRIVEQERSFLEPTRLLQKALEWASPSKFFVGDAQKILPLHASFLQLSHSYLRTKKEMMLWTIRRMSIALVC